MNDEKQGFDEMQRQKRNNIGNQMFMVMTWAFLVTVALHGAEITWIAYPANIMVIISVCMSIYLIRLIASNTYLPPKAQNKKGMTKYAAGIAVIAVVAFAVAIIAVTLRFFGQPPAGEAADNSAIILVVVSSAGLLVVFIASVIKRITNRDDKNDKED